MTNEIQLLRIERNVLPPGRRRLPSRLVFRVGGRTYLVPVRCTIFHTFARFQQYLSATLGILIANTWPSDDAFWLAVVESAREGGAR